MDSVHSGPASRARHGKSGIGAIRDRTPWPTRVREGVLTTFDAAPDLGPGSISAAGAHAFFPMSQPCITVPCVVKMDAGVVVRMLTGQGRRRG